MDIRGFTLISQLSVLLLLLSSYSNDFDDDSVDDECGIFNFLGHGTNEDAKEADELLIVPISRGRMWMIGREEIFFHLIFIPELLPGVCIDLFH